MRESLHKAGQRVAVGFDGYAASADVRKLIRDYGVGHVVLFARNVDAPAQVADLVRELQSIARDAGHDLPLMVSVDQEGGRVARLRAPWTVWPPLRAVGRTGSDDHARRMGAALAAELLACGIRLDFAPVVDVDSNPRNPVIGDRSFGSDPAVVGRLGAAFILGLQGGGVAACAKHFPGHGDTATDSHLELPVVEHPLPRLREVELPPFARAIEAGVATIMTAHVLLPEVDEHVPATLSPRVVSGLLRDEMKYAGVIVSDDLEMKAVANLDAPGALAARAAAAGCDLLLVCRDHDVQAAAVEGLVRALEAEELSWRDMDDAVLRLRRLKERWLLPWVDPDPRQARAVAGHAEHLAREIAEHGGIALA